MGKLRSGWVYVLAAALLAGLAVVAERFWLPGGIAAGVGAAAAVIGGVWSARGTAINQERARDGDEAAWLVRLDKSGCLPLVCDLDDPVTVGVHPAAPLGRGPRSRTPPFVGRDSSAELCKALLTDKFVVLVGESAAGKTRAAYETVRELFPRYRLVEPLGKDGLRAALREAGRSPRCVLWLDDLERFLGPGGLTGAAVANLLAAAGGSRYIVATLRAEEHARFSGGISSQPGLLDGDTARHSREVLRLAVAITLPRSWTRAELARATGYSGDPRVAGALEQASRFGVAEYLAAGPQLLADWQDGWAPGTHPRGAALVLAAVDARRAGIHRPLPVPLLEQMHEPYLLGRGGALLRPEPAPDALAWAATPLHATSGLLVPAEDGMFLAFDYLIDGIPRQPVPASALDVMISYATPEEAMNVGSAAWHWGRLDQAEAAFRVAETGGTFDATAYRYYVIFERDGTAAALAFARKSLDARIGELGPEHPDTFEARRLLLGEEGDAGIDPEGNVKQPSRVAAEFAELHAAADRALGPQNRTTLSIRYPAVYWTLTAGDAVKAVSLAADLVADSERIFGAVDSLTRSSRWLLAECTRRAGEPQAALHLMRQLLTDVTREEGEHGSYSMRVRQTYADWLGQEGNHQDAAREWNNLVADLRQAQGDLHASTLHARRQFADNIGRGGAPGAAVRLLDELVTDAAQVTDGASLDLLVFRRSLAEWTGEAGKAAAAADQLEKLAQCSSRERGAADRYTRALQELQREWAGKAAVRAASPE